MSATLPSAPPCLAWCEADHALGGWDDIDNVHKVCECSVDFVILDDGGRIEVVVDRLAFVDPFTAAVAACAPRVRVGDERWATPAQAETLAKALAAAAELARST